MPKYGVKWNPNPDFDSNKTGGIYEMQDGEFYKRICNIHTWGFQSCAVHNLQSFGYVPTSFEDFWDYVDTLDGSLTWHPGEVYFLLSDTQLLNWRKFTEFPNVKKIDRFLNKAHGPNHVNLFRYSKAGDWKGVE